MSGYIVSWYVLTLKYTGYIFDGVLSGILIFVQYNYIVRQILSRYNLSTIPVSVMFCPGKFCLIYFIRVYFVRVSFILDSYIYIYI